MTDKIDTSKEAVDYDPHAGHGRLCAVRLQGAKYECTCKEDPCLQAIRAALEAAAKVSEHWMDNTVPARIRALDPAIILATLEK